MSERRGSGAKRKKKKKKGDGNDDSGTVSDGLGRTCTSGKMPENRQ
jgi:hypothetical protein